jgi:hypothetical protein
MSEEIENVNGPEQQPENESLRDQIEREAALFAQAEEVKQATAAPKTAVLEAVVAEATEEQVKSASLGKAQKFVEVFDEDPIANEIGWKPIPLENLPSGGIFYPEGSQLAIRSASVAEIRHWSTLDENDLLGVDDMLNYIVEKCVRLKIPGKPGSFKDVYEIDRFYLIFAVRDYTFKSGENKMMVRVTTPEGLEENVEVTKEGLDYFNPDERLMRYFDPEDKSFQIRMKNGEEFRMYMPTLGTMSFIKSFIKQRQQSGVSFDKTFIKYAPFLFKEWKIMNQQGYDKAVTESYTWSLKKISVLDKLVEILTASVNPKIRYVSEGGQEGTAPLNFQSGVKSIFLISDIFDELV